MTSRPSTIRGRTHDCTTPSVPTGGGSDSIQWIRWSCQATWPPVPIRSHSGSAPLLTSDGKRPSAPFRSVFRYVAGDTAFCSTVPSELIRR